MPLTPRAAAALEAHLALALAAVEREYPGQLVLALESDRDLKPPRELHPAFFGAYDWHSAVHNHWLLVRVLRLAPRTRGAARAREILGRHLTGASLAAERRYLEAPGRAGFERPYGLAWLLTLAAELRAWAAPAARRWGRALAPLERLAARRQIDGFARLPHPIRSGEHAQTAFALGLTLDWARGPARRSLAARARELFAGDRDLPLHLEPSGHDFLSPALGEADLLRRVLAPRPFASWLERALPGLAARLPAPVRSPDPADGKLAHLGGLNLSRAWMLEGIALGLPPADGRRGPLLAAARDHARAGLRGIDPAHYAGSHWLPSFAVYLATGAGR